MKKRKWIILLAVYIIGFLGVHTDSWLYETPIVKIHQVDTAKSEAKTTTRGGEEQYYKQSLIGTVLNGTHKGESITLKNEYSFSGTTKQKYHKGDYVLVSLSDNGNGLSGSIKSLKRDTYLYLLFGALVLLLIGITGRKGALTVGTMVMNLVIFGVGFVCFINGTDILMICNIMVLAFSILTLICLNGMHKSTFAAIISTLLVLLLILALFDGAVALSGDMDYSSMEYLGSLDNPSEIFRAEIMLAGLGAIMDVAVTISAALEEIICKNPQVKFHQLFTSGREIGHDIMGTMINVLLFVFACGLIPTFIIRMNNDIPFFTIINLYIPYEICRFLVESIGIVLAIPVAILVTSIFLKSGKKSLTPAGESGGESC